MGQKNDGTKKLADEIDSMFNIKRVAVEIEGIKPLLMHRFPEEEHGVNRGMGQKQKVYDPQKEAEKTLYKDGNGKIYQPSIHLLLCLVKAGTQHVFKGKQSYKDIIKSCVEISPDKIEHKFQEWEIDTQSKVVEKKRIMRYRARFDQWALEFVLSYDADLISFEKIREIVMHAGRRHGLGDERPLYGQFVVTKFQQIKE